MSAVLGRDGRGTPARAIGRPAREHRPPEQPPLGSRGVISEWFSSVAGSTATAMGTPWAFLVAAGIILAWAISGPLFHFSDTWQLVINTGTTIVTFLMVFLIQNTQNRDARALHLKLDELLRAVATARTDLIDIEEDTDQDLERLREMYRAVKDEVPESGTPRQQLGHSSSKARPRTGS
jgi:low affinity Fe/Cu permease